MNIKELREKRGLAIAAARAYVEKASNETRAMTADETAGYDKAMADAEALRTTIEACERQEKLDKEAAVIAEKDERAAATGTETREQKEVRGFRAYLTGNSKGITDEFRALQQDADSAGGYLTLPMQLQKELIVFVKDLVFIRSKARVIPVTNADSLGIPTLAADPSDADWTNELSTGSEDTTMSFGLRDLKPHPVAKRVKISNKLLRVSVLPVEEILRDRFGYKFAITEEKAFQTGSGANQPLGLFTASNAGIDTSRDVSAASQTVIAADDLINTKYSVKAQYQANGEWLFHRDAIKQIAKLKDGDGQYLWQAGLVAGQPDRILGRPVNMSEYSPNTFTTGKYVGLFGDFSKYWVADALTMQVQRLNELYAESNQTGFIMRKETDGMPVLAEAFARLKLA
jgi:HK97 family phage major capsid protein